MFAKAEKTWAVTLTNYVSLCNTKEQNEWKECNLFLTVKEY